MNILSIKFNYYCVSLILLFVFFYKLILINFSVIEFFSKLNTNDSYFNFFFIFWTNHWFLFFFFFNILLIFCFVFVCYKNIYFLVLVILIFFYSEELCDFYLINYQINFLNFNTTNINYLLLNITIKLVLVVYIL